MRGERVFSGELEEGGLVEHPDAETLGVVGLRAGILSHQHVVGFLRHRARHPAAQLDDEVLGLVAGHGLEAPGEDENLSRQGPGALADPFGPHDDAGGPEPLDRLPVGGLGEELDDGLGDLGADAVDLADLRFRGFLQAIHVDKVRGQELGGALAHVADAQPVQEAGEPAGLRLANGLHQVRRRFLRQALEPGDLLHRELVKPGKVPHHLAVHELAHHGLPEVLDVHGAPRAEVQQPLLQLGRAGGVGAAPDGLALGAIGLGPAGRALGRHLEGMGAGRPFRLDHLDHVGDHIARALDQHRVAHADIFLPDLVLVVEARPADRHPGQLHRLEQRRRSEGPRLPDVDLDLEHPGRGLARRELEGDGPARVVRRRAQPPLLFQRVHLHHHAVGVVAEAVALGFQGPAEVQDGFQIPAAAGFRIGPEAGGLEPFERLPVALEGERVGVAHVVEEDVQRALGGDRGIFLAHRPGRRVARVGEGGLPGLLQLGVELRKRRPRHVDLAPHLQRLPLRQLPAEGQGDRLHRAEVLGDLLAAAAVPTRGPAEEAAALVEERDAQAVHLGLADVLEVRARQRAPETGLELLELGGVHGVVEREHGDLVLDGGEDLHGLARHALGGAVGRDEVRVRLLQRPELPHEAVVLGVGDLGAVLGVVEAVVVADLLPQLLDPLAGVGLLRHGRPPEEYHRRLAPFEWPAVSS